MDGFSGLPWIIVVHLIHLKRIVITVEAVFSRSSLDFSTDNESIHLLCESQQRRRTLC
jgi:hypothetical protein